jgi:hypothetical protein
VAARSRAGTRSRSGEFRFDLRQGFAQHNVLVGHARDDLRSEVLRLGPRPELVHDLFVIAVDNVAPKPALGDQLGPRELSDGRAQRRPGQKAFCGGAYFLTFGFAVSALSRHATRPPSMCVTSGRDASCCSITAQSCAVCAAAAPADRRGGIATPPSAGMKVELTQPWSRCSSRLVLLERNRHGFPRRQ